VYKNVNTSKLGVFYDGVNLHIIFILYRVWSIIKDGFWTDDSVYCTLWYSAWLHLTVQYLSLSLTHARTHAHKCPVMSSLPLLGSGFQRQMCPFFYVPELSLSLSYQLLKATAHRILLLSFSCRLVHVGAPSLTGEQVSRLQLLLALTRAVVLGSESNGTRDHILLFQIRNSSNLEGQVPVFISPRNRVA
jgi:hypothetical protein